MPIGALINGYFDGVDKAIARKKNMAQTASELESLPDRTQAARSEAQLQTRHNQAALSLADAQQENASKTLRNANTGLDAVAARQPDELATQSNMAHVQKILSDHSVGELPGMIAEYRAKRLIDTTQAQIGSISKLADLIETGDKKQVIGFMNGMRKANPDIGLPGDVHDVNWHKDAESGDNIFTAYDQDKNPVLELSRSQMQRATEMIRPSGKDNYKVLRPGQTLVKTSRGLADPVYTAPALPGTQYLPGAKPTTMEQNLNMLTTRYGMSDQEALTYINTSKTGGKNHFVQKAVQDQSAIGRKVTQEDIQAFGQMYDDINNLQNKEANTGNGDNLDPGLKRMLEIN